MKYESWFTQLRTKLTNFRVNLAVLFLRITKQSQMLLTSRMLCRLGIAIPQVLREEALFSPRFSQRTITLLASLLLC